MTVEVDQEISEQDLEIVSWLAMKAGIISYFEHLGDAIVACKRVVELEGETAISLEDRLDKLERGLAEIASVLSSSLVASSDLAEVLFSELRPEFSEDGQDA